MQEYLTVHVATLMTAFSLGLSAQALAQECSDPQTQQAMDRCARAELESADAELNEIWPQALEQARLVDEFEPPDMQGAEAAISKAQSAWMTLRDGHCEAEGFQARGSSFEQRIIIDCRARLTRRRSEQLKNLIQVLGTQ